MNDPSNILSLLRHNTPEIVDKHIRQRCLTFSDIANLKLVCSSFNIYWTTEKICSQTSICAGKCSTFACSIVDHSPQKNTHYIRILKHFAATDHLMFWHLFEPCRDEQIKIIMHVFNVRYPLNSMDILNVYHGSFINKRSIYKAQIERLHKALENKDLTGTKIIIENIPLRPKIFATEKSNGLTLLESVCHAKDLSIFRILLEKNKKHLNAVNKNGISVLQTVAAQGTNEMLTELLKNKPIDINFSSQHSGKTALHFAASAGKNCNVNTLCEIGANTNILDSNMNTALHCCIKNGRHKTAEILLKYNQNLVNTFNKYGSSPLHLAARRGALKCGYLLLINGACINIKNALGKTPLHIACLHGKVYFVEWLLNNGASVNALDELQRSPLDLTIMLLHEKERKKLIINLLKNNGAKRNFIFLKEIFPSTD